MSIQSILFDRSIFKLPEAMQWISDHGYQSNGLNLDITKQKYRFRQQEPLEGARYRTKKIADGIEFIFEFDDEEP